MRIAVLFKTIEGPWGGGNQFLRSMKRAWQSTGIEVTDRIEPELDGVLLNSSYIGTGQRITTKIAKRLVARGYKSVLPSLIGMSRWNGTDRPPFVHRLDGVFRLYGRSENDAADLDQTKINEHMDWTIFQSQYCKTSFASDGLDATNSTVVLNGVDLDQFTPSQQPPDLSPFKLIAVAWSSNPMKGFARTAEASRLPGVEVTFVGNWPTDIHRHQVNVVAPQNHSDLSQLLRQHHGFLHMAQNDPCSNALMEGLASGLPAVFHPSGGSPEIVKDCGIPGEPSLAKAIAELIDRYDELRYKVLDRREEFSIHRAASDYLGVFKSVGRIDLS